MCGFDNQKHGDITYGFKYRAYSKTVGVISGIRKVMKWTRQEKSTCPVLRCQRNIMQEG